MFFVRFYLNLMALLLLFLGVDFSSEVWYTKARKMISLPQMRICRNRDCDERLIVNHLLFFVIVTFLKLQILFYLSVFPLFPIDKSSSLWYNGSKGFVDLTACLAFLLDRLDVAILSAATPFLFFNLIIMDIATIRA